MSLSDWEDDEPHSIRVAKQNKWDDEDVDEEDVKENWEESSDDEKEKTKTTTTTSSKKKISAAQKAIAKREKMNNNDDNEEEDELDDTERRRRERQAVIDADLENTKGMFGIKETESDELNSKDLNNAKKPFQDTITKASPLDSINPRSKDEFDKFSKLLVDRIRKHEKSSFYVGFINDFVHELCLPLKETEVRKVASTLTSLANEKKPKDNNKPKKKVNNKPALQVDQIHMLRQRHGDIDDSLDPDDYKYNDYDEYEDFM